ncbi:MAG TPA: hypothetical protein PLO24_00500 [Bacteroidales bacterium]|jgi:hypothetical protein|nr:hypothetical protein [Bacteroidales bacterium]HOS70826.1 hypothetical protein [Bacteroidales bacterium]HQH24443.1 hypothetical protein [Bacteroidales bacterium]HQJ81424.1 hypothetical protein [Bacteroidales bacterium]
MISIEKKLNPADLSDKLAGFWEISGRKINLIEKYYDESQGSPVFTVKGRYSTRGWTEWTQGFQYGSAFLQFDATGDKKMLDYAREKTVRKMAPHVSHTGVHDHGFNNVSTYGNLLRLMNEGKIPFSEWEKNFCELALKVSGAVQASRWTAIRDGGYIYSFNGAHSLFVDTIRSCRILMIAHRLGHVLQAEGDIRISLLERALEHLKSTARYSVYYGEGRDIWDTEPGRTAHESVFNPADGSFRCPSSQQGYTGFTTWTRGLAWAVCGFSEQLEWIDFLKREGTDHPADLNNIEKIIDRAARVTCDFYIKNSPSDGVPYWDTGAPGLVYLKDYLNKPSDPFNEYEPVDSSAAAIAAQGLLRLGHFLKQKGDVYSGSRYWQAGLKVLDSLLSEPYLSTGEEHQGLLLHSVYHRPNGWDHIPEGSKIPNGESSMWGDYHIREACLYLHRIISNETYYNFFSYTG